LVYYLQNTTLDQVRLGYEGYATIDNIYVISRRVIVII